jgi:hypothetical protein
MKRLNRSRSSRSSSATCALLRAASRVELSTPSSAHPPYFFPEYIFLSLPSTVSPSSSSSPFAPFDRPLTKGRMLVCCLFKLIKQMTTKSPERTAHYPRLSSDYGRMATMSPERVSRVMLPRVHELEEIEEHDNEDFLCILYFFRIVHGVYVF